MKTLTRHALFVGVVVLGLTGTSWADSDSEDCTLKTLHGRYIFTATGHNIVGGIPQPKAIIEVLDFDGSGRVSGFATRSVNGVVLRLTGTGGYAVERACVGTITFDGPGPTFDVFLSQKGDKLWMIQTNPDTVFSGIATRLTHEESRDRDRN